MAATSEKEVGTLGGNLTMPMATCVGRGQSSPPRKSPARPRLPSMLPLASVFPLRSDAPFGKVTVGNKEPPSGL